MLIARKENLKLVIFDVTLGIWLGITNINFVYDIQLKLEN